MMDENRLEQLIAQVQSKFNQYNGRLFEPYIKKIRFPRYKSLIKDTRIDFEFPLTILVGVNGTNKTSVLQALYGTPGNKNVGNYWFSTDLDKIDDVRDWQHCLIYSYYHQGAKKDVEFLKTRVNRTGRLDYWEPSRPLVKYDMKIPTKSELELAGNHSTTRWDALEKNVVFCDFKDYISAFDMYFYNYIFEPRKTYKTRQDFIRNRSAKLAEIISGNQQSYLYRNVEMVNDNYLVSDEVRNIVSSILDQNYEEIRIISHKFYSKGNMVRPLKTILMKTGNLDYTEAFAGSGESRLIMLINDIVRASSKSLILIDEPEINLHPKAITKFQTFLLEQILKKSHQIILTTHSHFLVDKLPSSAVKLFQNINGEISITGNIDYNDAFVVLGESLDKRGTIIVEDKLAKAIMDHCIGKSSISSMKDALDVQYLAGGVQSIISQHIYSSAMKRETKSFYVLDGDSNVLSNYDGDVLDAKWIVNGKIDPNCIPDSDNDKLDNIIKELTNIDIKFQTNSGSNKLVEKVKAQRQFLNFWETNVSFLNSTTPERAIIASKDPTIILSDDETGKNYFKVLAEMNIGESPNAEEILVYQKQELNSLPSDCPLKKHVNNILEDIWKQVK